jgi:hypothetical protein
VTDIKTGSWVRIGDTAAVHRSRGRPAVDYREPTYGKVQGLAQGGLRAVVRLHRGHPEIRKNEWCGEEVVDISTCSLICRPSWDVYPWPPEPTD